jgi:hypothetical protein
MTDQPLEEDEQRSPRQINSRPELLKGSEIHCRNCGLSGEVMIPVVVTVGKNGSVTWIRPRPPADPIDPRIWAAVLEGLELYQFQPALSPEGPVADYADLRVRVVPSD